MKVTVVVPVYNPGAYIEPCIKSLLAQSMPSGDFEVIFVDDGSTDTTPDRLDELAKEHPHVHVIHQENSGWPGKPRNVGVEAAEGEYVQFLDQDDSLGPRALEKLYELGARNQADIVLGKVTSDFRGVPHGVFRDNVDRCTIRDFPLIDSLTPHKMFRRAFLTEHGIAYPEGRRRLEDQLYMVRAYLAANVVSIVGDYPCYFYMARDDGNNAGSVPIEPAGYYANLREVLDVITTQVEPGEFRETLLRRFYRNELLGRLAEPAVLEWEPDYLRELFDEVRRNALARFPDVVPDGLDVVPRIRSVMLRDDRLGDLVEFAERLRAVHCRAELTDIGWQDGQLEVGVNASQWLDADRPLHLVKREDKVFFDPYVVADCVPEARTDVTVELHDVRADVVVRNRRTNVEWFVPADLTPRLVPVPERGDGVHRLEFSGVAHFDPLHLGGQHVLSRGTWDAYVRIHALGLVNRARLGAPKFSNARPVAPAALGPTPHVVIPVFTEYGNLTLDIDEHVRWLAGEVAAHDPIDAADADGRVGIDLPIRMSDKSRSWPARITLAETEIAEGPSLTVTAEIENRDGFGFLTADLAVERSTGPVKRLRPGRYEMFLHSGTRGLPPVRVGTMTVSPPSPARRAAFASRPVSGLLPRRLKKVYWRRRPG